MKSGHATVAFDHPWLEITIMVLTLMSSISIPDPGIPLPSSPVLQEAAACFVKLLSAQKHPVRFREKISEAGTPSAAFN